MTSTRPLAKRTTTVVLIVTCVFSIAAALVTRAMWSGRSALAEGDRAAADGHTLRSIDRYARAARWYVPGAHHVGAANQRLRDIAQAAQQRGDSATATIARQALDDAAVETAPWSATSVAASAAPPPNLGWFALAAAGLFIWFGGALYFARRGVTASDRLDPSAATAAAILVVIGLLVWVVGLYKG